MTIHARPLTQTAFAAYGTVLEVPAAGRCAPVAVVQNRRPGVPTTIALLHLSPGALRIDALERHPRSGQCFLHLAGGRLLVVVAPDAGGAPDLARIEAFVAGPRQGFDYAPGVWHAGVAAIDGPASVTSLLCRNGDELDVEAVVLGEAVEVRV